MRRHLATLGAVLLALLPQAATGAATPEAKCGAAKNRAAGDYARCRQAAEAKLTLTGDAAKYAAAIDRCEAAVAAQFAKAESAAAKKGAECPTTGDAAEIEAWIAAHADTITAALAAGGSLPACGNGAIDLPGEACDQTDLGGRTCEALGHESGTVACTAGCELDASACTNPCRFAGGQPIDGHCWFIGNTPTTESCDAICGAAGRTCDEVATASIATLGTLDRCLAVADAFVTPGTFAPLDGTPCGAHAAVGCAVTVAGGDNPTVTWAVVEPTPSCLADGVSTGCGVFQGLRRICACD
jgi:hypothetical protein